VASPECDKAAAALPHCFSSPMPQSALPIVPVIHSAASRPLAKAGEGGGRGLQLLAIGCRVPMGQRRCGILAKLEGSFTVNAMALPRDG